MTQCDRRLASQRKRRHLAPQAKLTTLSVADWVSHYRLVAIAPGALSGSPSRGTPREASPGPGRPRGKFPARAAPRGPRPGGPPGAPKWASREPLREPQNGPILEPLWGPIYILFCITDPPFWGVRQGALFAPPGDPPGGGPPGDPPGGKKCTFFWVFNNSPSRDSLGPFFRFFRVPGTALLGGHLLGYGRVVRLGQSLCRLLGLWIPHLAQPAPQRWQDWLGRRASDGYPLAGLTANGWYVPSGRSPPSR